MPRTNKGIDATSPHKAPSCNSFSSSAIHTSTRTSANLHFFATNTTDPAKLKAAEKKLKPHRYRLRFNYQENHTASLSLPVTTEILLEKSAHNSQMLELAKNHIVEHANLRVDLFFYTLIAYYQQKLQLTAGSTHLQYGKGRNPMGQLLTEACHNSLFPSLIDENILPRSSKKASILNETHFMCSLNSTTELPPFVNDLDDILEQLCREKSLAILRAVSMGTVDPIAGISLFLQLLNDVLGELKQKALAQKDPFAISLIALTQQGSLANCFDAESQTVRDEYLHLLMRLSSKEKKECLNKHHKPKIYMAKFMELQKEILETQVEAPTDAAFSTP